MVKIKERRIALLLRKEGKSYSQIKKQLHLSKSTLSRWLGKYPLSKERISELRDNNQQRIESFRNTMFKKKENKMLGYYKEQQKKLLPLTNRELFFAGLFLYWGEGNKATPSVVSINNTDPEVLKFTLFWFIKSLQIPKNKIKAFLHLYRDMNVHEQMNFWSKTLNLSLDHFDKPFINSIVPTIGFVLSRTATKSYNLHFLSMLKNRALTTH